MKTITIDNVISQDGSRAKAIVAALQNQSYLDLQVHFAPAMGSFDVLVESATAKSEKQVRDMVMGLLIGALDRSIRAPDPAFHHAPVAETDEPAEVAVIDPNDTKAATKVIEDFIAGPLKGASYGVTLYTPEAWQARGEKSAKGAVLIVTHEACPLAEAFNDDPRRYKQILKRLDKIGCWPESVTNWATAIYKRDAREESDHRAGK